MSATHAPALRTVRVWDAFVRMCHWTLVLSIAGAWLTRHSPGRWHEWIGYASLAIVALRLAWGFAGSQHARLADFVRSASATMHYARELFAGAEPRYLGHNPLGGWMIVALLLAVTLVGLTGWLYTTDRFWGIEWMEQLHSTLSDILFALAGLHIAGAIYASFRHRENLIAAMLHGRKRIDDRPDPGPA